MCVCWFGLSLHSIFGFLLGVLSLYHLAQMAFKIHVSLGILNLACFSCLPRVHSQHLFNLKPGSHRFSKRLSFELHADCE